MIIIGLTGSIGMGKSTVATMLQQLGVPVHDSDAQVHELLEKDKVTRAAIAAQFPYLQYFSIYGRKGKDGNRSINRKKLGKLVFANPKERKKLESILHPLVQKAQSDFIRVQRNAGREMIVLDIPLLFETGADKRVDTTIAVSAPAFIQAARVLSRPNMDPSKFANILKTQMPDAEKCARADYILPTGLNRAHTMRELKKILARIREAHNPQDDECNKEDTIKHGA